MDTLDESKTQRLTSVREPIFAKFLSSNAFTRLTGRSSYAVSNDMMTHIQRSLGPGDFRRGLNPPPAQGRSSTRPPTLQRQINASGGVDRWHVLGTVRDVHTHLGLGQRDLAALHALLSCLPNGPVQHDQLLVVFASNAELCLRANQMNERTLRRALDRLVTAGLVARRDSATRKRFPLRGNGGQVLDAYGIDLRPLFIRYEELMELARADAEEQAMIRKKRAELQARRREILERLATIPERALVWLEEMGRALRRRLTVFQLTRLEHEFSELVDQLLREASRSEASRPTASTSVPRESADRAKKGPEATVTADHKPSIDAKPCEPSSSKTTHLSAADGHSVRHVEANSCRYKTERATKTLARKSSPPAWSELAHLREFYPREPKTSQEMQIIIMKIAEMMRLPIAAISEITTRFTPWAALSLLDHLIGRREQIQSPGGYVLALVAKENAGHRTILSSAQHALRASMQR
jgi:replication initiation protein RepC